MEVLETPPPNRVKRPSHTTMPLFTAEAVAVELVASA